MSAEKQPAPTAPPPQNNNPPPVADPSAAAKGPWYQPEWRDSIAGEDKDFRKQLDRFTDPDSAVKSWKELSTKISSGEYKKNIPFPKEGTPEQQAEWRKETGIPESPDKYDLKFDNGLVIGEDAKPVVDKWLQKAHAANMPPDFAKAAIASYMEIEQEHQAAQVQEERAYAVQQEETLRTKWGPEYLPNKNIAEDFAVNRFGPEIGKAIMSAGPGAVEALAAIARELNPSMTVVPNSSDPSASIADEIKTLEAQMGTIEWKADKTKQQRYLNLIEARGRMKK